LVILDALIGTVLSSVVFVADYMQLDFNGPRLTCWVWPTVSLNGEQPRRMGDPGYRDALCALISQELIDADESALAGVVLSFASGSVSIRPDEEDLSGPEIAMLQLNNSEHRWDIWRPGEGIFEYLA
jgi:hypothetical protein